MRAIVKHSLLLAVCVMGALLIINRAGNVRNTLGPIPQVEVASSAPAQREHDTPRGARVMLLAYMRTGSTFTAELLTLNPQINYMFEPLALFQDTHLTLSTEAMERSAARFLRELTLCDALLTEHTITLKFINRIRFDLANCWQKPMLMKLIRVRGSAVKLMLDNIPELKLIHLVRDPRGTANSRANVGANKAPRAYCNDIRQDLRVMTNFSLHHPDRYTVVRYEDLADEDTRDAQLERLYRFMGVELPPEQLEHYLRSRYRDTNTSQRYGTKKKSDFDPHHWRRTLTLAEIRAAEDVCADVMRRFQYTTYQPSLPS